MDMHFLEKIKATTLTTCFTRPEPSILRRAKFVSLSETILKQEKLLVVNLVLL